MLPLATDDVQAKDVDHTALIDGSASASFGGWSSLLEDDLHGREHRRQTNLLYSD